MHPWAHWLYVDSVRNIGPTILSGTLRSSNLSNRSLYLITDHDDPFHGNKQQQKVALVFANVSV